MFFSMCNHLQQITTVIYQSRHALVQGWPVITHFFVSDKKEVMVNNLMTEDEITLLKTSLFQNQVLFTKMHTV